MEDKKKLHISPDTYQIINLDMADGDSIELIVKKKDRDRLMNLLHNHLGHIKPS